MTKLAVEVISASFRDPLTSPCMVLMAATAIYKFETNVQENRVLYDVCLAGCENR